METITAITERRSVKHYQPDHEMTNEELEKLISLAALSPTSFNMQNWRFVVVADADKRQAIRDAAWNQAQVTEASALIVICADLQAHATDPKRYWANAPQEVSDMIVPMLTGFYEGNEQLQRDEANRSAGLAGQTIMLAAKEMGYDSCPMVGFDPAKVSEIINLPENHYISFMITVGKVLKEAQPRGGQLPLNEIMIKDSF